MPHSLPSPRPNHACPPAKGHRIWDPKEEAFMWIDDHQSEEAGFGQESGSKERSAVVTRSFACGCTESAQAIAPK